MDNHEHLLRQQAPQRLKLSSQLTTVYIINSVRKSYQ